MKTSHKIALAALTFGIICWTQAADPVDPKPKYDYWVASGQSQTIVPGMEARLKQGYEVERLELAPLPQGYSDAIMVVILRRPK